MENADILITEAQLSDIKFILEIEQLCFDSDRFSKRQFNYLIKKAKGVFYIVRQNGNVVAYASLIHNSLAHYVRIYSIAVHPESRGKNIARILIQKTIEFAQKNMLSAIRLEVKTNNEQAIRLYEKCGFEKTGTISAYYQDGSDAFVMKLPVNV